MSLPTPLDIPQQYVLPDVLAELPWPRLLSEHYEEVKVESSAWIESFNAFNAKGMEAFRGCELSLLSALTYSPREKYVIRLGADLMNLFFTFDEYTDVQDPQGARLIRDIVNDAFSNPDKARPEGEVCLGRIAQDFWKRTMTLTPPGSACLQHLLTDWQNFGAAVVQEADDRADKHYRTYHDYMRIRRHSSGSYPTLAVAEFGLDLPEEVYEHPIMYALRDESAELIALINDIYSFAMERSRGLNYHNSIPLVMLEQGIGFKEAVEWLRCHGEGVVRSFNKHVARLPSWGLEVDKRVRMYVDSLAQNIRGVDDWTFECQRYFGPRGLEIQQTRVMSLFPPTPGYLGLDEDNEAEEVGPIVVPREISVSA